MSAKIELKFKHQQFQIDACNAVCDIFAGQPKSKPTRYILDPGKMLKIRKPLLSKMLLPIVRCLFLKEKFGTISTKNKSRWG